MEISKPVLAESIVAFIMFGNTSTSPKKMSLTAATQAAITKNAIQI